MSGPTPELPLLGDRLKRAIAAFVRELFPSMDYLAHYAYSVVSWDAGTQTGELTPDSATTGLPTLARVPVRLPGIKLHLSAGDSVLVGFENGDRTRPWISALGSLASGTLIPSSMSIGGDGPAAAREGDTIDAGTLTLAQDPSTKIVTGSYVPGGGGAPVPFPFAATALTGHITSGSSKVEIGG